MELNRLKRELNRLQEYVVNSIQIRSDEIMLWVANISQKSLEIIQ